MQNDLNKIRSEFTATLAAVENSEQLDQTRIKYLGRKDGILTKFFDQMKHWPLDQKRALGGALNELKHFFESQLQQKSKDFSAKRAEQIDITVPPLPQLTGHLHPITQVQKEIEDIFVALGFDVRHGPEIDSDFYNFEALNIPEHHPARDMQDTFYLDLPLPKNIPGKHTVLRTHVSNMQVRYMQQHQPPFAVVLPGRVFRNEALDASHEHTYQYMEGMLVGSKVSMANMSWTLDYALKALFGEEIKTKLLPSYFPFVEPGAEMAVSCLVCKGKGCSVCKYSGWVEILGCGMIHQKVFEHAGYKQGQYTGFAFGFGLSRLALMKYSIPDIRMFAENDLRFLNQF